MTGKNQKKSTNPLAIAALLGVAVVVGITIYSIITPSQDVQRTREATQELEQKLCEIDPSRSGCQ